jgi:hypothetical protein
MKGWLVCEKMDYETAFTHQGLDTHCGIGRHSS